ncbi:hypothetical protein WMY93_007635 [Mugilogobius chulae]|uniref:Uncharacterized protein n=1 Tax=Mugilogobius chulae TaxID=88201 RepID=A0AAW0PP82_9GOBI
MNVTGLTCNGTRGGGRPGGARTERPYAGHETGTSTGNRGQGNGTGNRSNDGRNRQTAAGCERPAGNQQNRERRKEENSRKPEADGAGQSPRKSAPSAKNGETNSRHTWTTHTEPSTGSRDRAGGEREVPEAPPSPGTRAPARPPRGSAGTGDGDHGPATPPPLKTTPPSATPTREERNQREGEKKKTANRPRKEEKRRRGESTDTQGARRPSRRGKEERSSALTSESPPGWAQARGAPARSWRRERKGRQYQNQAEKRGEGNAAKCRYQDMPEWLRECSLRLGSQGHETTCSNIQQRTEDEQQATSGPVAKTPRPENHGRTNLDYTRRGGHRVQKDTTNMAPDNIREVSFLEGDQPTRPRSFPEPEYTQVPQERVRNAKDQGPPPPISVGHKNHDTLKKNSNRGQTKRQVGINRAKAQG